MSGENNKEKPTSSKTSVSEDMKRLVIERIKVMSSDFRVAIGPRVYSKEDLLKCVKSGNKIGKTVMRIEMEYLRDMASGKIYKD